MSVQIFYLDKTKSLCTYLHIHEQHINISTSLLNEEADSVIYSSKENVNQTFE